MATMRPFFSFYGGKWRTAIKLYPSPVEDRIIEPFAGSAGYSLRYSDHPVTLCDLDPIIAGIWRYLINVKASEILRIPDVSEHVSELDNYPQEVRHLVGFWLNRGSVAPCNVPSAWARTGLHPGSFWGDRVRNTIASQVDRIRHWRIIEGSYYSLPRWRGTWFIDPPYTDAGQVYRCGSNDIDFNRLATFAQSLPGQVICCEQEGATWLPFRPLADVKTTRKGRRSVEVIWTNR